MDHITVVENTGLLQINIKKILEKYGFTDVDFYDFKTLSMITYGYAFRNSEMIFIDYDVASKDVTNLIEEIKGDVTTANIPIIVLVTTASPYAVKTVIKLGVYDIIVKPFNEVKFMEKVFKYKPEPTLEGSKEASQVRSELENGPESARMMPEWHDDFRIGNEEVDTEHRELIEQYERLYQLMKKGEGHSFYDQFITFLQDYIKVHFDDEEKLQQSIGFDEYDRHKELHENFKAEIQSIADAHKDKDVSNMDLIKFNMFIKSWLVHHILVEDKKIGVWLSEKESSEV